MNPQQIGLLTSVDNCFADIVASQAMSLCVGIVDAKSVGDDPMTWPPQRKAGRPFLWIHCGREGASLDGGRKRGGHQAIVRSRGDRTTKFRALTDAQCRALAFMLTGGQVADCTVGSTILERLPDCDILHGDKGNDGNAIRLRLSSATAAEAKVLKAIGVTAIAATELPRC
jgi:hypothetical protein